MISQTNNGQRKENARGGTMPGLEAFILFGLWVLLSGKFDAFHLIIGAIVVAYAMWQDGRLGATSAGKRSRRKPLRAVLYGCWLFWQMILSAVYVGRVIISPRKYLDPQLIQFHSEQPSLVHAVVLANSITLTPGTLTLDLNENRFLVHALTPATAREILNGEMAARVARLSNDEPIPPPVELPITEGSHEK